MKIENIASLITIRNYTYSVIDNVLIKLSNEEVRALRNKLPALDKKIVESIIALDLSSGVSTTQLESSKKKNENTK